MFIVTCTDDGALYIPRYETQEQAEKRAEQLAYDAPDKLFSVAKVLVDFKVPPKTIEVIRHPRGD